MAISIADSSSSPTRGFGLLPDLEKVSQPKQSMWQRLGLRRWLGRDSDRDSPSPSGRDNNNNNNSNNSNNSNNNAKPQSNLTRRISRRVGVGLPRTTTFKRQNSERRDRLAPADPEPRRAVSADRRGTLSTQRSRSPQSAALDPRLSMPEVQWFDEALDTTLEEQSEPPDDSELRSAWHPYGPDVTDFPVPPAADALEMELDKRWILNLSMHFRDRSEREKFFVTFAEAPNRWRRVTISCDYRDASPDSLEQDLKELRYQRDKSIRIYESIRESLPEIQFYDTVTNLKLETRDGRLHVHVTEDVNEIIPYPPTSCVGHLYNARLIPEYQLHFEAHLSGFVYKVQLDGKDLIKKEIPGPDTVDEFLYEINALHALHGSSNVIQFEGIVVDDRREVVKGLLISYAEQGALVDILYERRGTIDWPRRERWAKQIVHGLCEIHESGYVQGDFTLSNIVIDSNDHAKIIDINRRGCPVGWEPPEIAAKIESNQRISMYIGVKTDIFQLGMTLWALAMQEDEPERQSRPLLLDDDVKVPDYFKKLVAICLSPIPRHRLSAKELLSFFPPELFAQPDMPPMHPSNTGVGMLLEGDNIPTTRIEPSLPGLRHVHPSNIPYPPGGSVDHLDDHPPSHFYMQDAHDLSQVDSNVGFIPPSYDQSSYISHDDREPRMSTAETLDDARAEEIQPDWNYFAQSESVVREEQQQNHVSDPTNQHTDDTAAPISHSINEDPSANLPRSSSPFIEANEIDLDATVEPIYRDGKLEQEVDLQPFQIPSVPGELAGIGGHAVLMPNPVHRSSTESVKYPESPLSSATSSPTDPSLTPMIDIGHAYTPEEEAAYSNWTKQAPTHSVSSLLHSTLPINPAFDLSKAEFHAMESDKIKPNLTIPAALDRSGQDPTINPSDLTESHLPVNPAFTGGSEESNPRSSDKFNPGLVMSSGLDCPRHNPLNRSPSLTDSHLPINPAFTQNFLTSV